MVQALGHRDDGGLRGCVDGSAGHGDDATVGRRGVDDVALLAVVDHVGDEDVEPVCYAEDVDPERPAPVVGRVEPQLLLRGRTDAGIVAEHVDVAELSPGHFEQRLNRGDGRDIGECGNRPRSGTDQSGSGRRQRTFLDVGEDQVHTFGGEPLGDGSADPARCSRHDSGSAC